MRGRSRPTLLIVGSLADLHVQRVCQRLDRHCHPLVIDYSTYLTCFHASLHINSAGAATQCVADNYDLSDIRAVWWRRPLQFRFPSSVDEALAEHLEYQASFFWTSLLDTLPETAVWYNDWTADFAIDRNLRQLTIAKRCGFLIPNTLVTSSSEEAEAFLDSTGPAIVKHFAGSKAHWRPTAIATLAALRERWAENPYPVILQQRIDGVLEYRVAVINERIVAVQHDMTSAHYSIDVRLNQAIPCKKDSLPDAVESALRTFMDITRLRFGAFDLRCVPDGSFYFLEVNPAGQFIYLDDRAGTDITGLLASALSCPVSTSPLTVG
jgi:hypothetical protein